MIAESRIRHRIGALSAAAVLLLAGCSAGQVTQTADQHPTIGGASADVGELKLRNITLEAPEENRWVEGDDVQVNLTIVNNGSEDDELLSVETDAAESVLVFADAAAFAAYQASVAPASTPAPSASDSGSAAPTTSTTEGASPSTSADATESGTPSASATPTESTTPSTSSSPATTAGATPTSTAVELAANTAVRFAAEDSPVILLVGLKEPLGGGETTDLTFNFAEAGSVTVTAAVALTGQNYENAPTMDVHPTEPGRAGEHESEEEHDH